MCQNLSFFKWNHFWATFIVIIWQFFLVTLLTMSVLGSNPAITFGSKSNKTEKESGMSKQKTTLSDLSTKALMIKKHFMNFGCLIPELKSNHWQLWVQGIFRKITESNFDFNQPVIVNCIEKTKSKKRAWKWPIITSFWTEKIKDFLQIFF